MIILIKNQFIACEEVLRWQIQTSTSYLKDEVLCHTNKSKARPGGASSGDKADVIMN